MTEIKITSEVGGFFQIEAFKVDAQGGEIPGSRRIAAPWFKNLITDAGLNLIGSSSSWLQACQVGAGSTPPAFSDTALSSRVAGTTASSSNTAGVQAASPYFAWRRKIFRFAAGVATGNLSEVGVGTGVDTLSPLLSRALILDSAGNPTTITVQSDETLDVAYEFRYYVPSEEGAGSVVLGGETYTYISRAAGATNPAYWEIQTNGVSSAFASVVGYSGLAGSITGLPSGVNYNGANVPQAYANNSQARVIQGVWDLDAGNSPTGLRSFLVRMGVGSYQFQFDRAIPKDATKVLSLNFRHSWARRP